MWCKRDNDLNLFNYRFSGALVRLFLFLPCIPLGAVIHQQTLEHAEILEAKAHEEFGKENYAEAVNLFGQAAEIFATQGDPICQAQCLVACGKSQIELRNYDKALATLEMAEKIYEETSDAPLLDKGICLWQKGRAIVNNGNYDEGLERLQAALTIIQSIHGAEYETAGCLKSFATVLYLLGKYEEALKAAQECMQIYEIMGAVEEQLATAPLQARILNNLKRLNEAVGIADKALSLLSSMPNLKEAEALWLMDSADWLFQARRYEECRPRFEQSLAIHRTLPDMEKPIARILCHIGICFNKCARYEEAIAPIKESLDLYQSQLDSGNEAICMLNLGDAYRGTQDYQSAQDYYTQAIERFQRLEGYSFARAMTLLHRGQLSAFQLNNPNEALLDLLEAEKLFSGLEVQSNDLADCMKSLADVYMFLDRYEDAAAYHDKIHAFWGKVADSEVKQANALLDASVADFSANQFEKARERNMEALNLYQSTPESEFRTRYLGRCYLNIGLVSKELKQYDEAEAHLENAIGQFLQVSDENNNLITSFYTLGDVFFALKKKEEGNARYQQAFELIEASNHPNYDPPHFFERWAHALYSAKHYEDAAEKFSQAERAYRDDDATLQNRIDNTFHFAECLKFLERDEEAINAYKRVLEYPDDDSEEMLFYRLSSNIRIAHLNMGIQHFEEALKYAGETQKLAKDLSGAEIILSAANMAIHLCSVMIGENTFDPDQADDLIAALNGNPDLEPFICLGYQSKGHIYVQNGEYRSSLDMFRKALDTAVKHPDADRQKAVIMIGMASALGLSGEYEESITHYQQARSILKDYEDGQEDVLRTLLEEANMHRSACQFDEAFYLNDEALFIAKNFSDPDHFLGLCYQSRSRINYDLLRYEEAMLDINSALTYYRNINDTNMEMSDCLFVQATLYKMQGQYEKAQKCLLDAYILIQESKSKDSYFLAKVKLESERLLCLAGTYSEMGQIDEAYDILHKALALVDQKPYCRMLESKIRTAMAEADIAMGRIEEALTHLQKAELFYEQSVDDQLEYGLCLMVKGMALSEQCRYTESLMVLQRTLDFLSRKPGWKAHYADCLMHASQALVSLGRFEEALTLQKRSIDLISGNPYLEHHLAMRKLALAITLIYQHQYTGALRELDEVETVVGQLPGAERQRHASKMIRAICLLYLGRHEDALTTIEESQEILKAFPEILEAAAETEKIRAMSLATLGRYEESLEATKSALGIYTEEYPSPRNLAEARFSAAFAQVRLGRTAEAQQELHDAHTALYDLFVPNFPMMTEQQKTEFVQNRFPEPDPLYTLAFSDGNLSVEGLDTALMHKGLIEYALQQEQHILQEKSLKTPEVKSLYETLQELRRRYAALSHSQDSPLSASVPGRQSVNPIIHKKTLDDLKNQIDTTETQLAEISRPFAEEMRLRRISTNEVHEALNTLAPEGALFEYVKYEPEPFDDIVAFLTPKEDRPTREAYYGLFILRADSPIPIAVDLGPAAPIDEAVAAFRTACRNYTAKQKEKKVTYLDPALARTLAVECAEAGEKLRSLIFDPALLHLSDCKRLFIAPDDALFLLPFEAFPTPDWKDKALRYLVEEYEIIYLNAGRDLARIALQSKETTSAEPSVIVAGPNMEMPMTTYLAKVSALQSEQSAKKANAPDAEEKLAEVEDFETVQLAQEPSTVMEDTLASSLQPMGGGMMETLQDLLFSRESQFKENQFKEFVQAATNNLSDAQVYTWEEAIEERVKVSSSPRLLQILTHGLFLPMDQIMGQESFQNPLLRSLLVLAGATTIAREKAHTDDTSAPAVLDDGLLTAYEVTGMNLQGTELVALTACQTALFDTMPGQSVAGLRRAFSLAGAQSMIMAQWEVPVGPSAMQMEYFYDAWLGKQNAIERYTAFHEAQLEALRFARKEDFKGHPWIWAGFVYIGDPGTTQQPSFGKSDQ